MFSKKINAVMVVDIGASLKLLNVQLLPEIKVSALKIISLAEDKKDEIILKAIGDFIRENKVSHKNAVLTPYLDSLLIRRLQLPVIPEAELTEAVKWKLKEEASFGLSAAAVDFSVIRESVKEDGSKVLDCICAAAKTEEIKPQVLLLKQAGLNCLSVTPLAFGYAHLVGRYFLPQNGEAIGILHIAEDKSFITVHKEGKIEFYRQLPISINKFRESLAGTLATDQGLLNLTPQEIDSVLFEQGIPQQGILAGADKAARPQVLAMLRMALERLAQEIKRSLNYYGSQFQGGSVKKILVAGRGATVPGLDKFLSAETALNMENISLSGKVKSAPGVDLPSLARSSGDLGLSLDYIRNINLLPAEFRSEKIEKLQKVSLRWVALSASLLLFISYIFSLVGVAAYQRRLESAQLYLNVLSEVSSTKAKIDGLHNFIADIRKSDPDLGVLLKKLSNLAPKEMFLNSFSLHCEEKILSLTGSVTSSSLNPDVILTKFMQEAEDSAYFREATLSSVEKSKDSDDTDTVRFKMSIVLP